jgi:hypothetical protein
MSSYQDVNWGYNTDAPITEDPLPLSALNDHLARFGYQMTAVDPLSPLAGVLIQWEKKGAPPITLAGPQFRAENYYDQLVYDLHDIRDMLSHLNKDGISSAGHELVAKRRPSVVK